MSTSTIAKRLNAPRFSPLRLLTNRPEHELLAYKFGKIAGDVAVLLKEGEIIR